LLKAFADNGLGAVVQGAGGLIKIMLYMVLSFLLLLLLLP